MFVTHDRWFVDRIANSLLEIRDGATELHLGNHADLLQHRKAAQPVASSPAKKSLAQQAEAARRPGKEAKHLERQRQKAEKLVKDLEGEVSSLEESIRQLEEALGTSEVYLSGEKARAVTLQRDELRKRLDTRVLEWEEAAKRLEEVPR
jgi:ATP-binding cassette subfamily F protein 3